MQTSQPPPNDVESTARPKENGKSAPEAKPISVEETTATEDAPKAAVEAVAPAVVAATSAAAAATAEKPKPQSDCVVCGHLARNFCSSCKHVFYCTRYRFVIFSDDSMFESTERLPITSPPAQRSPEETLEGPQGGMQEPGDIALSSESGKWMRKALFT